METPAGNPSGRQPPSLAAAVAVTVIPVLTAVALARVIFAVRYGATAVLLDVLLLFPALALASKAVRGRGALWGLGILFSVMLVLGHAVKVAFLGIPLSAADIAPGIALLRVLSGGRLMLAVITLTLFVGVMLWAAWPRRRGARYLLAVVGYAAALIIAAPGVSGALTHGPGQMTDADDPVTRLQRIGGTAYLLRDFAQHRQTMDNAPDQASVARALGNPPAAVPHASGASALRPRNVHLILLEAFWDPLALKAYRFSRDPLDPRFRALWERGAHSTILTPVFGGSTANAEFEVLCGLPALSETIVFADALSKSLPCLPRVLREAGYLTIANHPNKANYWNRGHAYPLLGFERYNAIGAFQLDDMDGMFLDDASTFRQTLKRIDALPADRPYLNYVVSLSTHYPYGRNSARHPTLVTISPETDLLEAYSNALAYSSAAFMDYVEAIRAKDPDALIVAFGDHAPVLGFRPDPYALSGMSVRGDHAAAALVKLAQTPLLVIDGQRGAVAIGQIPLYALPSRMLALLDDNAPKIPYAAALAGEHGQARVFLGRVLTRTAQGWELCNGDSLQCRSAAATLDRGNTLRDDLIGGRQYALKLLHAEQYAGDVAMTKNDLYGECVFDVIAWGPQFNPEGRPFNVQASGRSALWFKLRDGRGTPELLIGEDATSITFDGKFASASYLDPEFLRRAGRYPVGYRCRKDGEQHDFGTFDVKASVANAVSAAVAGAPSQ